MKRLYFTAFKNRLTIQLGMFKACTRFNVGVFESDFWRINLIVLGFGFVVRWSLW